MYELDEYHRGTSDNELIADVRLVAKLLARNTLTIEEYNENGRFHATTLTRRFGSWFIVLKMAGLQPSRSLLRNSDEKLFENLEEVWSVLGRQPKYSEMLKPLSKFSAGTYEKRFGTWRRALKVFVEYISENKIEPVQEDGVRIEIKTIRSHRTQRGVNHRLRFQVLRRDDFKCVSCGASPATESGVELQVDHVVPWAKGGETTLENLQSLCAKCNIGKSDTV